MTRKILRLAGLCAALGSLPLASSAGDVYVIANDSLALVADEGKDVYLGDKQIAGGTRVVPLDNAAVQKEFLEKVIQLDAGKYGTVWTKKGFRDGLAAPAVKNSDAEVLSAVKRTPGAVGYVSNAPPGVKIIRKY